MRPPPGPPVHFSNPSVHFSIPPVQWKLFIFYKGIVGLERSKTVKKYLSKFWQFLPQFSPRAAGRRRHAHRLRWLPVGGPPLGEFFSRNWSKLTILRVKTIVFMCFYEFSKKHAFRENYHFCTGLFILSCPGIKGGDQSKWDWDWDCGWFFIV